MPTLKQYSFSGGEIAPALYARTDQVKYQTGLRTMRNFITMRHGGASNRPGTLWVGEARDSTKAVILVPFVFNAAQTYVLEFGDYTMKVIKAGSYITNTDANSDKTLTGISKAAQAVCTAHLKGGAAGVAGPHYLSNGDEIIFTAATGMLEVFNRQFLVSDVTANTFKIKHLNGTYVNSTSFSTFSTASYERVYTLNTPYSATDLAQLKFVQSADVLTFVHPLHPPRTLSRYGDADWRFTRGSDKSISGVTKASPGVVTCTAHGFSNGQEVFVQSIVGMTELNNRYFKISDANTNDFKLKDFAGAYIDTSSYTAYSSGGTASLSILTFSPTITAPTNVTNTGGAGSNSTWVVTSIADETMEESLASSSTSSAAVPTSGSPITVNWTAVSGAQEYNVYRMQDGLYGLIGTAGTNAFVDRGPDPDTSYNPPESRNPFVGTGNYPSTVSYFQQRLVFANTVNDPEKVWTSQTANFYNFSISTPIQDDDAVTFNLAGRQVNAVQNLLELNSMVSLTSAGEWIIEGNAAGILTPAEVNPKQHSYNGSASLSPIVIGADALYVQARGTIIRDLGYDYQVAGYRGNDLTVFSAHLFDDYSIVSWAYQQIPHSIVWVARDDGALLGCTYVKEHEMLSWNRHDTDGFVEQLTVVPEGTEDALYMVVKRTIDDVDVRYIERMYTRQIDDIKNAVFVDSSLSFDGRDMEGSRTGTATFINGTTWAYDDTDIVLRDDGGSGLSATDVGKQIHVTGPDGTLIRFEGLEWIGGSGLRGRPHKTIPASMRNVALSDLDRAVNEVTGLWHLEGKSVAVFADAFVVANPNNPAYVEKTVSNGTLTLDRFYTVITVGLPYVSDLETLDLDTMQAETLVDKNKNIGKVTLQVENTRGLWVGASAPSADDQIEGLTEIKTRNAETYEEPVALTTGELDVLIRPEWNGNGRVFIRQLDPIPASVLSICPSGYVPLKRSL